MNLDRFKSAVGAVLESIVGARLDYLARYPARVVTQASDGRLELKPDDPRIPGIPGVPIRLGVPGMNVEIEAGARVLLAFESGDPSRPVAELWESGTPVTLTFESTNDIAVKAKNVTIDATNIKLGAGALFGVARIGDTAGPYVITSGSSKVSAE